MYAHLLTLVIRRLPTLLEAFWKSYGSGPLSFGALYPPASSFSFSLFPFPPSTPSTAMRCRLAVDAVPAVHVEHQSYHSHDSCSGCLNTTVINQESRRTDRCMYHWYPFDIITLFDTAAYNVVYVPCLHPHMSVPYLGKKVKPPSFKQCLRLQMSYA